MRLPTLTVAAPAMHATALPADDYLTWSQVAGVLRRRWPLVLLVTLVGTIGALVYAAKARPVYEAAATLQLAKEQYNLPEMVTNRATDEGDLSTQLEVLRSSALANLVVRDLGLNVSVADPVLRRDDVLLAVVSSDAPRVGRVTITPKSNGALALTFLGTPAESASAYAGETVAIAGVTLALRDVAASHGPVTLDIGSLSSAAQSFRRHLRVGRGDRNANVIWLRYRDEDPQLASTVLHQLANAYIDLRATTGKEKVQNAIRYLQQEADTLRRQMLAADQALQSFRQREGVVSLADEATTSVTQGAQLRAARTSLEAERSALQKLITQADTNASAYRRLTAFPTLIGNPIIANLLRTVADLEGQRTTLLVQRTSRDPDVQALASRIGESDGQLRSLTQTYLSGLQNQIASLDQAIATQSRVAAAIPGKSMQEDQLSRAPRLLADVYAVVETRLQEARIAESAANAGVALIDPPDVPLAPIWPRKALLLAVGIALGLLAGGAIAWFRESTDASIHSRADVARIAELPVLSVVPHIGHRATERINAVQLPIHRAAQTPLLPGPARKPATIDERIAMGAIQEAYAWLETAVSLSQENVPQTVLLTSPLAREGKTVSAANLAVAAARNGRRVVLIDADLRRGPVHEVFSLAPNPGLTEILAGRCALDDAIQSIAVTDGLSFDVIPRGGKASHPIGLLKSGRLPQLIDELKRDHDLILIDSPPVNLVSDALVLAVSVDAVILVARAGVTDASALGEAVRHLREVEAPLLGVVLNDIRARRDRSYDDSYKYLEDAGAYAVTVDA